MKEKYQKFEKDGKDALIVFKDLIKDNSPLKSVIKLREVFPELTLAEVKEILIITETDHKNLNDYQQGLFDKVKKYIATNE